MFPKLVTIIEDWIVVEQRRVSEVFRSEHISGSAITEAESFCSELVIVSEFALQQNNIGISERCLDLVDFWRLTIMRLLDFQHVWRPRPTTLLPRQILLEWSNSVRSSSPSVEIFKGIQSIDPVLLFSALKLNEISQVHWDDHKMSLKKVIDDTVLSLLVCAENVVRDARPTLAIRDGEDIYWQFELPDKVLGSYSIVFEVRERSLNLAGACLITDVWLEQWRLHRAA